MNPTKTIAVVIVIILIGIGVYVFSKSDSNQAKQDNTQNEVTTEKFDDETVKGDDSSIGSNVKAGSYETYSPEKLTLAENGKVVLFFRASWCPTCRTLHSNIRSNINSIPEEVTILDVDYDNSTALKQKYGVTYQHTLVQVDDKGDQITKWTGSLNLTELISKIK